MNIEEALIAGRGLVVRRDHRSSGSTLDRALRSGALQRIAPGLYAAPGEIGLEVRARAVLHLDPSAVIVGTGAAALTWWPELPVPVLEVASRARSLGIRGVTSHRRTVPPDLVVQRAGVRATVAPLTVLDLIPDLGGNAIDEALRRRVVTLSRLWRTFEQLPRRRGDVERRRLLIDSRDEPWSEAERALHRHVRSLELPCAYRTNYRVSLPDGSVRFLDVALPDLLLGFEADGFEYHGTRRAFVSDRAADAALAALGWQRIRFDASSLLAGGPGPAELIGTIVAAREALLRGLPRRPLTEPHGVSGGPVKPPRDGFAPLNDRPGRGLSVPRAIEAR